MKKSMIALSVLAASISAVHAGSMGPVSSVQPGFTPFVAAEGSFTWNPISSSTNGLAISKEGWGGRGSVGANRPWIGNWGLGFEAGYGYYGNNQGSMARSIGNSFLTSDSTISTRADILGADLLAGLSYTYNQVDLFAKVGVMVETLWLRASGTSNMNLLGVISTSNSGSAHLSETAVLPEIKVGGNYNVNESVGLSLAYMHVFGANPSGSGLDVTAPPAGAISPVQSNFNLQPLTLDAILFGIHYNFA